MQAVLLGGELVEVRDGKVPVQLPAQSAEIPHHLVRNPLLPWKVALVDERLEAVRFQLPSDPSYLSLSKADNRRRLAPAEFSLQRLGHHLLPGHCFHLSRQLASSHHPSSNQRGDKRTK